MSRQNAPAIRKPASPGLDFFSNQHRYHIGIGLKIHVDDIFRNMNFVVFPMGANGMVCHSKQIIWYIPSTVAFGQAWRWPSA